MAVNSPNSPRQKMINLMYLVFIGMLALNVSTEVLDGFKLVEEGQLRSVKSATQRNERIFEDLKNAWIANPEKTKEWYEKGEQVKARTDSLFNYTKSQRTNRHQVGRQKRRSGKSETPRRFKCGLRNHV